MILFSDRGGGYMSHNDSGWEAEPWPDANGGRDCAVIGQAGGLVRGHRPWRPLHTSTNVRGDLGGMALRAWKKFGWLAQAAAVGAAI